MLGSIESGLGEDLVVANLLTGEDLVGHGLIRRNGSQSDDVGLDLGLTLSNDFVSSGDQDRILRFELERLAILSLGAVGLDAVAVNIGGSIKVREHDIVIVVVESFDIRDQLDHLSVDVELLPDVDGVDSLAIRNLQIRGNGDLVANLNNLGLGLAIPVDDGNGALGGSLRGSLRGSLGGSLRGSLRRSLGGSLRGSLGRSLRGSLRRSLGRSLVVALNLNVRSDNRSLVDLAVLDHLEIAGAEGYELVDDFGSAAGLDFEVDLDENLLAVELVAGALGGIVAKVSGSVVRDLDGTALEVGQNGIDLVFVVVNFGIDAGENRQHVLIEVNFALELGDVTDLAASADRQTGHVQGELIVDDIANVSGVLNAVDGDGGILGRSLGGSLGRSLRRSLGRSLRGSLGSGLIGINIDEVLAAIGLRRDHEDRAVLDAFGNVNRLGAVAVVEHEAGGAGREADNMHFEFGVILHCGARPLSVAPGAPSMSQNGAPAGFVNDINRNGFFDDFGRSLRGIF